MALNPSLPYAYVGDDDSAYFRTLHGRNLNALNSVYLLPVDEDEVKVTTILPLSLAFHLTTASSVQSFIIVYFSSFSEGVIT